MSATAIFELLAALAAFAAAIFLVDQQFHRPRPYKLLWSLGLLFYGIAAAAAFAGAASHWTVAEFKVWYFFGGTVTAVFLGLGSFYLLGPRRGAPALPAARPILPLLAALVVLSRSVWVPPR